ncbi:ensconsin-like isoform X2 [Dermacentor albipictus]|uniref:ensconsin-like isoform X2 n=1 Tax=Dermacentor albipictus TaxID=60249 RepID=UPI0038FD278C
MLPKDRCWVLAPAPGVTASSPFHAASLPAKRPSEQMAANTKDLVAAIKVALPLINDDRMLFLMQELGAKDVRCKADMKKLEAVDLVNALGTNDAKRLVAFFRTPELSDDIITDGARFLDFREPAGSAETEAMLQNARAQVESDHRELVETLDREKAKRQEVHEATMHDVALSASRHAEEHREKMEQLQAEREAATREHEERLQRMREEDKLRAQKRQQEEREHREYLERLQRERQRPSIGRRIVTGVCRAVEEVFSGNTTGGSSGPANLSQDFNGPPR